MFTDLQHWLAPTQMLLAFGATVLLALAPPARGDMLLVSIGGSAGPLLTASLARDGRLIAAGPLPGSWIIRGERDRLAWDLLRLGGLVIAATPAGCGKGPVTDAP